MSKLLVILAIIAFLALACYALAGYLLALLDEYAEEFNNHKDE